MKRNRFWFVCIVLMALMIRIGLIYYALQFRENTDILRWKDWTRISFLYGFSDTYTMNHIQFGTLPNNMPPGTLYIQYIMYLIGIQISKLVLLVTHMPAGSIQWLNGSLITILFRMPSIISDLIMGGFIYNFIKKITKNSVVSCIGMGLFLFNPVILYNSAVWGQMDAVVNVFFITSLYFLFKKKIFFSMLFFLLCLCTKLSLVYVLPICIVLWWINESKRKFFLYSTAILFIGYLLVLPINSNPFIWLVTFITNNATGEMTNITAFAMNIWWVIFHPFITIGNPNNLFSFSEVRLINSPDSLMRWLGVPLFIWAVGLFIAFCIPLFISIYKYRKRSIQYIFLALANCSLLAFTLLPQMHERYMYPAFVLLAVTVLFFRKFIIPYSILTLCNLINIYIVWHPMPVNFFPYQIWTGEWFQWVVSLITVITVFGVYIQSLRLLHEKR